MGEYTEFGRVWSSKDGEGIGEFQVIWGVGSSMGGIQKEWGSVGGRVGKCVAVRRSVGAWREVWGNVLGCGKM